MAQNLFDKRGSHQEQQQPVAYLECEDSWDNTPGNIASAFAEDGTWLGDIGYQPCNEAFRDVHYLFIT